MYEYTYVSVNACMYIELSRLAATRPIKRTNPQPRYGKEISQMTIYVYANRD
jgi:hypothetical protein